MRKRADRFINHDTAMFEDFPELGGGFGVLVCSQIRFSSHVDVERGPGPQFVGRDSLQRLNRFLSFILVKSQLGANPWQEAELDYSILRKAPGQIIGKCFCLER